MGSWAVTVVEVVGRFWPGELVPSKPTGFFGMAPPDNGVNYCDIDFGFCDELPAVSSLPVLPDNGVSGESADYSEGCPTGSQTWKNGSI